MIWRLVVSMVLMLAALFSAPSASAEPHCIQEFWLYGGLFGRGTTRTICDGPIQPDGSWRRARNFYDSERYIPAYCSRYSCRGGYWLNVFDKTDIYWVTPDTVLPDEPGHIE